MLKENQRVVDLSNVDTNAKAFILGIQCGFQFGNKSIDYLEHGILRVEKTWKYGDYNIFKDFVEREFDATVESYDNERIKNGFIERSQRKCYDIDINEYRYVRCYRYYNAYIRITPQSRCYIKESLPMLKKEFYPYTLINGKYVKGYATKLESEDCVLYNLPDVIKSDLVFFTEGEIFVLKNCSKFI